MLYKILAWVWCVHPWPRKEGPFHGCSIGGEPHAPFLRNNAQWPITEESAPMHTLLSQWYADLWDHRGAECFLLTSHALACLPRCTEWYLHRKHPLFYGYVCLKWQPPWPWLLIGTPTWFACGSTISLVAEVNLSPCGRCHTFHGHQSCAITPSDPPPGL